MAWSGFITNNGISQARNATNNPGWYLIPYKFKVSSTKGYLNANSVIDDLTNIWYEAYFTSLEFLENNKILHKITIPIDAESISKNIGDIAFIYKDPDDNEYLFAVSKNSDTLWFEPGISREYDFAFTLNNTNVADIYNIQYTFPLDIATHNIDPIAHTYLLARDGSRTATNPILYENVTDDALLANDNSLASVNLVKNVIPVGTVIQGYFRQAPDGFLKLDGSSVSKETYSRLYQHLLNESLYGEGLPFHDDPVSPSTHFILQDARSEFFRNWDDGRGVDAGRELGSWQEDELREHSHSYNEAYRGSHQHGPTFDSVYIGHTRNANTGLTGGSETRPRNIALTACIKY